jgi:drug/metabolite transporter (DMT)-like permease
VDNLVLLAAVLLLALSQILQKQGAVSRLRAAGTAREWALALLSAPLVFAFACIVAGTALWLYVLYRMDLSRAYPFVGLGTVVVVALSRIWLKERVSALRWFGVSLIAAGTALVASS